MGQLPSPCPQVSHKEDKERLDNQRNGDQHDIQRIVHNYLALEREDDNKGKQQSDDCDIPELGNEGVLEIVQPAVLCDNDPGEPSRPKRNHHEQDYREEQSHPRNGYAAYSQQQSDDRYEGGKDYQVVGRDLHQRVGRVSLRQVAPYEHHGRTGSSTQKYSTRQILSRQVPWKYRSVDHIEEEYSDTVHREGFDQPVGDPGDHKPSRILPDFPDTVEIDLKHHGIDHQPNEDRYRNRDVGIFELGKKVGNHRKKYADQHTDTHAQQDPKCQVSLKKPYPACGILHPVHHTSPIPISQARLLCAYACPTTSLLAQLGIRTNPCHRYRSSAPPDGFPVSKCDPGTRSDR